MFLLHYLYAIISYHKFRNINALLSYCSSFEKDLYHYKFIFANLLFTPCISKYFYLDKDLNHLTK